MEFVRKNAPGILICLVIAVPAWLLGQRFEVVGGPVFAILIGMVIALFWKDQKSAKAASPTPPRRILQLAVVLLGFGMNLSSVLQVGGTVTAHHRLHRHQPQSWPSPSIRPCMDA